MPRPNPIAELQARLDAQTAQIAALTARLDQPATSSAPNNIVPGKTAAGEAHALLCEQAEFEDKRRAWEAVNHQPSMELDDTEFLRFCGGLPDRSAQHLADGSYRPAGSPTWFDRHDVPIAAPSKPWTPAPILDPNKPIEVLPHNVKHAPDGLPRYTDNGLHHQIGDVYNAVRDDRSYLERRIAARDKFNADEKAKVAASRVGVSERGNWKDETGLERDRKGEVYAPPAPTRKAPPVVLKPHPEEVAAGQDANAVTSEDAEVRHLRTLKNTPSPEDAAVLAELADTSNPSDEGDVPDRPFIPKFTGHRAS